MKHNLILCFLLVILALCGCSSKENYKEATADLAQEQTPASQLPVESNDETPIERKVIKEGQVSFETRDVKETSLLINKATAEAGGYLSKENIYDYKDRVTHRIEIRVPANKFDLLLSKISESADHLDSKNIDVKDVTEEYIDVEARIKTKKELENRYRELLNQAKSVEEILHIEKEIGTLRTEIESVEGRLRYLKDRIGFSTLTVEYYQMINTAFGFSSRLSQALAKGWEFLLLFIIGITHIWPFILLIGGSVLIAFRIDKKRKAKKNE